MNDQEWKALRRRVAVRAWLDRVLAVGIVLDVCWSLWLLLTWHPWSAVFVIALAYIGYRFWRWQPPLVQIKDEEIK